MDESKTTIKVLVVDDDSTYLRIINLYLEELGFEAHLTRSGDQALATLKAFPGDAGLPDLLLTDLVMEDMDGYALSEAIMAQHQRIKVLYMSTYPREELLSKYGWNISSRELLRKPFSQDQLLRAIAGVMTDE